MFLVYRYSFLKLKCYTQPTDCHVNCVHFLLPHKSNFLAQLSPHCPSLCVSVCVSRGGGGERKGVSTRYLPHKGPSAQPAASLRWGSTERSLPLPCSPCTLRVWPAACSEFYMDSCFCALMLLTLSVTPHVHWYCLYSVKTHIQKQVANFLFIHTKDCWRIYLVDLWVCFIIFFHFRSI